jgi:hypothetical protein
MIGHDVTFGTSSASADARPPGKVAMRCKDSSDDNCADIGEAPSAREGKDTAGCGIR